MSDTKSTEAKGPIHFFVERFVFSIALFASIALFGFLTFGRVGVDLLPRFEVPVVAISTLYAGAGPEEVANQISKPIEDSVSTLDGIDSIASTSSEGLSLVIVQFNSDKDVDQVAVDVSQRIAGIRGTLPRDAQAPVIAKFDPASQPILSVALSAPGKDLTELSDYADQALKPLMQRVEGVADVQVQGAPERQIQVLLNPSQLRNYNLSPAAVNNAIQGSSFALSAGNLNIGGKRNLFTLRNTAVTPRDVENILVDPQRGLKVTDVAVVRDASQDLSTLSRVNGEPVVSLSVRKVPSSNSVEVARKLREALSTLVDTKTQTSAATTDSKTRAIARLSSRDGIEIQGGYTLRIVSDTTKSIKATVDDTWKEVIITVLAVSLVCLVFLGRLNTVFSVVLAIPISLSGALILFGLLGFTFNIISLLAITVAVGIVVDDSIVVAENVERYRKMGYGLKDSVLKGASEVLSAVSAASLSLLAVFIPISFLPGIVGQFFREFGLVLAASVAMSWAEALFFLTVRMAYTPDPEVPSFSEAFRIKKVNFWTIIAYPFSVVLNVFNRLADAIHHVSEKGFAQLQNGYTASLRASLKRPWIALILGFALFLSLGYVGPKIPFNFTPKQDSGIVNLIVELPKGTALSETNTVIKQIENYLLGRPEVDLLETRVGASVNASSGGSAERAQMTLNLIPKTEREGIDALLVRYRSDIGEMLSGRPDVKFKAQVPQGGPAQDADYVVALNAPTPELLKERSDQFLELLRQDGRFVEVRSSLSDTTPEKVFVPDLSKLQGTGLTPLDIANALRTYNAGTQAAVLRRSGEEIPIVVKANPQFSQTESDLLSLPVFSQALGTTVSLGSLGSFKSEQSPASLSRSDQSYSAGIQANFAPGVTGLLQIQQDIQAKLTQAKIIDEKVTIGTSGSAAFVGDLASAAPKAFGLALLLNYLVIASQFNTFRYPLYLLIPVPLALIGAFWLAYILGTGLDVISVLATVLLIGLVTKNAILLLDFVVREARNSDLAVALVEAGRLRLRPILMTTATVFIISFPLILGTGEGGELRRPLGVIILGGLLTSTLLTLYVVPSAFYVFERRRHQRQRQVAAVQTVSAD
ncbi:MAG: efflux RND transporter permease subunit [Deinococcaceae bacterium]